MQKPGGTASETDCPLTPTPPRKEPALELCWRRVARVAGSLRFCFYVLAKSAWLRGRNSFTAKAFQMKADGAPD